MHLYIATIPWEKHARLRAWSHRERRVGLPIFFGGLQSMALQACPPKACGVLMYHLQLLTGNMSLAALLLTTPPTGHCNQETYPHNSPSDHIRDTHTSNGDQMTMPFIRPGGSLSELKGGRIHSVRVWPRRSGPALKVERWEASGNSCWRRAATAKPLKRTPTWCGWPGRTTSKCTTQNLTTKAPNIYLTCSRRWPLLLAFLTLTSTKSRTCRLARRTSRPPIRWQKLPKRCPLLPGSDPNWVTQDHGLERDPFPWGPKMAGWPGVLPLVWQGGAEWGHSSESIKDKSLPPGPHLWLVYGIFHDQHWHNAPSHAAVPVSNHPQWWWWWQLWRRVGHWEWRRWWWLHIYLGPLRMQISLLS